MIEEQNEIDYKFRNIPTWNEAENDVITPDGFGMVPMIFVSVNDFGYFGAISNRPVLCWR